LNNSKIFAGLMIITLNIASRFVPMKLSKTMESYLKNTFSKQILVFAMAWMGTRDIYIALIIVFFFTLFMDYLFNEDSMFCCLPDSFINHQAEVEENHEVTDDEIKKAKELLDKAENQKKNKELDNTMDGSKFNSLSLV
jgi:hypothetical protein